MYVDDTRYVVHQAKAHIFVKKILHAGHKRQSVWDVQYFLDINVHFSLMNCSKKNLWSVRGKRLKNVSLISNSIYAWLVSSTYIIVVPPLLIRFIAVASILK